MKRARTIIIRDPKLRKIRDNLRKILILESVARVKELSDRRREIRFDKNGEFRSLTTGEQREANRLFREYSKYSTSRKDSICFCELCLSTDKDMSYIPRFKRWFCVDCSKDLEEDQRLLLEEQIDF
ncbi:hypothetical protein LCGC14_2568270 [marine sediment metagenome]|uniref:Uncharacterized protein n=1 Tax=marine sediment metagenome TaxID=412755 RepID=A0A0F9B5Y7_9ZZZZ